MAETLRQLLIQRAARLQEFPAFSAPDFEALNYFQLRNRVEGVALGLMAKAPEADVSFWRAEADPWAWMAEVAVACCGFRWDPRGSGVAPECLGGTAFNSEDGRQAYHDREGAVEADSPFLEGLTQGELLRRLQRLNRSLGWDHRTVLDLPCTAMGSPVGRGALWSLLYAGGRARILARGTWDSGPFVGLLEP